MEADQGRIQATAIRGEEVPIGREKLTGQNRPYLRKNRILNRIELPETVRLQKTSKSFSAENLTKALSGGL
jgi:hypothetical protein